MFYADVILLKPPVFKRLTGVPPDMFVAMCDALDQHLPKGGRHAKHCLQDRLLITLMYWREYRTQVHTGRILATAFGVGRMHDFKRFERSRLAMHPKTQCLADSGYLGLKKSHENSRLPDKKSKLPPLTKEQKAKNRKLARERFGIEHSIRSVKIFRILSERYRNRRKRFGLRFNLIAALYNFGRPK